jgi:hypothetical protein
LSARSAEKSGELHANQWVGLISYLTATHFVAQPAEKNINKRVVDNGISRFCVIQAKVHALGVHIVIQGPGAPTHLEAGYGLGLEGCAQQ